MAIIQWCREARLAVTTVDRASVAAVAAEVSRERKCVTDVMVNVSAWRGLSDAQRAGET